MIEGKKQSTRDEQSQWVIDWTLIIFQGKFPGVWCWWFKMKEFCEWGWKCEWRNQCMLLTQLVCKVNN